MTKTARKPAKKARKSRTSAKKAPKRSKKTQKKKKIAKSAKKLAKKTGREPAKKKSPRRPRGTGAPPASGNGGTPTPPPAGESSTGLMTAPASGVKVRMYRQGHGDCFLLAFPGANGKPVYVLIDCGYKPGSNDTKKYGLNGSIDDIVKHIGASTDNRLDLVIVTHEHQDHVNGFGKAGSSSFDPIEMHEAWFAWTEDPNDPLANELRRRYHDQLLGLVAARDQLGADASGYLNALLSLELGVDDPGKFAAAAADKKKNPENSVNKQGMKLIKDKATKDKTKYILPHKDVMRIPGVDGVRVYALGPPHQADLIADEDPQGSEAFPGHAISARASFLAAATVQGSEGGEQDIQPFSKRFSVPLGAAFTDDQTGQFFTKHYGSDTIAPVPGVKPDESAQNAPWRRIDKDWLYSAEELALVLNKGINNTSLVLAFEFEKSKKVLMFVGDAQRGNWKSWTAGSWKIGGETITARDLMARTVLYKVGHHGSHNATLNGTVDSDYPCLAWMGQGQNAQEFTAMITAVNKWALAVKPKPWVHPLPSIKKELLEKTAGRLYQTDTPEVPGPANKSDSDWQDFLKRHHPDSGGLYFDYEVHD